MPGKFFAALLLIITLIIPLQAAEESNELKTNQDKMSYVIGCQIGNSLKSQETEPDFDVLIQAIRDTFDGQDPLFTKEEQ